MAIKTEAIVLGSRGLKEADRWYYVLSPTEGRLRLLLRGAGRSSSKLAGHLWPGNRVKLLVGRGRQDHVAGVTILNSFGALESLPLSLLQSFIFELIMTSNVSGQEAAEEYQLLWSILTFIHDTQVASADRVAAVRAFAWRLMSIAGWQPTFQRCSVCATVITDQDLLYYNSEHGFVCQRHWTEQSLEISLVWRQALQQLSSASEGDWVQAVQTIRQSASEQLWWRLTQRYIRDILGRPLRTLELYNYLANDVHYQATTISSR